jgi:4-diphosphocytidyl-2-C-methyl-D-erythritol kinase
MLSETAYAKINLALHVRRRREDGYHEIETLFAFVDDGDLLTARVRDRDTLEVAGEFAGALEDPFGNIVARALGALPRPDGLAVHLQKNLPVAAGLGGGSADAGALFRLVRELHGLPEDWPERAARLGADVPACVTSEMAIGRGTGTELEPVENDLAGTHVLLVNPRVPMPTGPVFKAWDGVDHGPLPTGSAWLIAHDGRNDLQPAAIDFAPEIQQVLDSLSAWGAAIARMSGSGATCFGLFTHEAAVQRAKERITLGHPGWWVMKGRLR